MVLKVSATEILTAHYSRTFQKFGANADGVDWGSSEKHRLRLERMIMQIGAKPLRNGRVLDVGCGYGEFLNVLRETFAVRPNYYYGIDSSLPLVETARDLHPGYRFEAVALETFTNEINFDHLVCCGVFTKKLSVAEEDMYQLLDALLAQAVRLRAKTVTFNTMSPLCDDRPDDLFFPKLDRIVSLLNQHWGFSLKKFCFHNDYLKYEMLAHIEI